ncbi:UNVERIFIED_CONTAM: Organic cation/carnitine transporter 7 [Sesamum calycinum]|uniref:Organic cation/carnitine transporter 7 n=1 Tax=Sesamum calycinum TaxID=2727403 RepID=A0AAW2NTE4_9LAMI
MEHHENGYTVDEALSSVGFGTFQVLALVFAGIGWCSDAMEVTLLSFIGPALESEWSLSPTEESLLSTAVFGGMLVGSYFLGFIADAYGRRMGIQGVAVITFAAGLVSAFSPDYKLLVLLRFFVGFGAAGGHVYAAWFLEFIPSSNRGAWMLVMMCSWILGELLEASLAWVYPTSVRASGYGLATAVGRIGGMICPLVAVGLVRGCHQTLAVIFFGIVILISGIAVLFFPFETKGRGLTDVVSNKECQCVVDSEFPSLRVCVRVCVRERGREIDDIEGQFHGRILGDEEEDNVNGKLRLDMNFSNCNQNDLTKVCLQLIVNMGDPSLGYTLDEALSAVGFGTFQGLALVFAGISWFSEAMEMNLLSFIGPAVKSEWSLSPTEESLLSTAVFGGMLVGALFWGFVSDAYGRRLQVTRLTSLYSWIWRGRWGMYLPLGFWSSSRALTEIAMPTLGWRWLLALSALPALLVVIFSVFVPESPRYLFAEGRTNEAFGILKKVALMNRKTLPAGILVSDQTKHPDEENSPSMETPLLSVTRKKTNSLQTSANNLFELFSSDLLGTTLLLLLLHFGFTFAFYGVVLMISAVSSEPNDCRSLTILVRNGHDTSLYRNVLITSSAEIPGLIIATVFVESRPQAHHGNPDNFSFHLDSTIVFPPKRGLSNFYKGHWLWTCNLSGKNWWNDMPSGGSRLVTESHMLLDFAVWGGMVDGFLEKMSIFCYGTCGNDFLHI